MTENSNDNEEIRARSARPEPDAHGQAALLLAESILHTLVDLRTLTSAQAVEIVQVASEVKIEVAALAGESRTRMNESLALLATIALSLATDVG